MPFKPKSMPYHRLVRSPGSVRQTVLSGMVDEQNRPLWIQATIGLHAQVSASTTSPLVISFADGFSLSSRPVNVTGAVLSSYVWNLPADTTSYLYVSWNAATNTPSFGLTAVAPIVAAEAPLAPGPDQHWFDTTAMRMKAWNGTQWQPVLRVFLATAVTDGTSVTDFTLAPPKQRWENSALGPQTIDLWSPPYKERVAGDRFRISEQQARVRDAGVVPEHQPAEVGGHLASRIVSRVPQFPTAEHLITEIRQGRGAFPSLPERVANLTGGFFTHTWSSGAELGSGFFQRNVAIAGDRLQLALEKIRHRELRYGQSARQWASESGRTHDVAWDASAGAAPSSRGWVTTQTTAGGGYGYGLGTDPTDAARAAYRMQVSGTTYYNWCVVHLTQAMPDLYALDPLLWEFELSLSALAGDLAVRVADGARELVLRVTETGFEAAGQNFSAPGGSPWVGASHLWRIVKYYDQEWRVFIDGSNVATLSYDAAAASSNSRLQITLDNSSGQSNILLGLRSLSHSVGKTDVALYRNIRFESDNTLTLTPGAGAGFYTTKPIDLKPADAVQTQFANLALLTDRPELSSLWFRSASVLADLLRADWQPVNPAATDNLLALSPMQAALGQFRIDLSGTGTVQASGTGAWPTAAELGGPGSALRNCSLAGDLLHYADGPAATLANPAFRDATKWARWTVAGNGTAGFPDGVLSPDTSRFVPRLVGDYDTSASLTSDPFLAPTYLDVSYRTAAPLGIATTAWLEVLLDGVAIRSHQLLVPFEGTKRLHLPDQYLGQAVQLRMRTVPHYLSHFVPHADEHANGEHSDPTWMPLYADLIETTLGPNYYMSPALNPGGNAYVTLRWKQTVTATEEVPRSQYPQLWVSTSDIAAETHYLNRLPVPIQVTPLGQEVACSATLQVPGGTWIRAGVHYGTPGGVDRIIEVRDLAVDWQQVDITDQPVVQTAQIEYHKYLYYPTGETIFQYDTGLVGTKWGHFIADGGLPVLAANADQQWERRIIKASTAKYLSPDLFEPYQADLVSDLATTGFIADTAFLFTTHLYNDLKVPVTLTVPVTSAAANTWELFRNRASLGRNKATYQITIQPESWVKVEWFFRHSAGAAEGFGTGIDWAARVGIMSSRRDLVAPAGMFQVRTGDHLPLDGVPWSNTGNDRALNSVGRYAQFRINLTPTPDRLHSNGTVMFGASYIPDVVKLARMTMTNVSENLARTNFELKTLTLADDHNLLHIVQDVFEDTADVTGSNWRWENGTPGIGQVDPAQPAVITTPPFACAYIPGYAVVAADAALNGGSIAYSVSRDAGATWQACQPGVYTELTSGAGTSVVLRAELTGGAVLKRWAVIL